MWSNWSSIFALPIPASSHRLPATLAFFCLSGQVGIVPKGTHVQVVPDSTAPWFRQNAAESKIVFSNDPSIGAREIIESISIFEIYELRHLPTNQ